MTTVTVPKATYQTLVRKAKAYEKIAAQVSTYAIAMPVEQVVEEFRQTKKYSEPFLADLKDGLKDLRKSKAWKSK
ncbi:hypothetical protein IT401_01175 [Candidatus Nomurabacteria bacterium]|nr:hypothetical protein [Candidatus Nomurabacteria bacterium]